MVPRAAKIDGSILLLRDIQSEDEGDYLCTVKNGGGTVTRKALLYVRGSLSFLYFLYFWQNTSR